MRWLLPYHPVFNALLVADLFRRSHGRWPRRLAAPDATINDFIFHRMIGRQWTVLQQSCSDKEYAKIIAAGIAGIQSAATVAIYPVAAATTVTDIENFLLPYRGRRLVLKPAHSCGQVIFLDQDFTPAQLAKQLTHAKRNYASAYRECQYINLEKKLILETYIEAAGSISDLKFFCAYGEVLLCQIDYTRFTAHKRAFVSVPEFALLDIKWKNFERPEIVQKPDGFDAMAGLAATLSTPFEFVRIDLYNTGQGIFFGEFTFTPGASMNRLSDEAFAIDLLRRVRAARTRKEASKNFR